MVLNGWGGPRNRADRVSDHIALKHALAFAVSAQRAIRNGLPFNRHLTVQWAKVGLPDREAAAATGRMIILLGQWVKSKGGRFAYAWVREINGYKGTHTHILFHLPEGLKLGRMTQRWAKHVLGRSPRGTVKTRSIGGSIRAAFTGSESYQSHLATVVSYLLKGVDRRAGHLLNLDRSDEGGAIIGKRVSVSQNLRRASCAP